MDKRMVKYFDKKKFMWDGFTYNSETEAKIKEKEYSERGFETRVVKENNEFLIYTRRVVKEIVITN